MKKITLPFLVFVFTVFCISCSSPEDDPEDIPLLVDIATPTDDLILFSVNSSGRVFLMGDTTGFLNDLGQIEKENSASILQTQTMIGQDDTIYAIEYLYNPSPTNNLLVYEISTNTTQIVPLTLPTTITGNDVGIIALALNGDTNLTAIVTENVLVTGATKHLVNINLQDYTITELGITFTEDMITSMIHAGTNIYISTWNQGFLQADTATNAVTKIPAINGSRLAQINATELGFMQTSNGFNSARPAIIDVAVGNVTPNSQTESYGLITIFGGTVYANQQYLNLVATEDLYFGVLKTDMTTGESTLTPIITSNVDRNMVIVNTRPATNSN